VFLRQPKDGSCRFVGNVGKHIPNYMMFHLRILTVTAVESTIFGDEVSTIYQLISSGKQTRISHMRNIVFEVPKTYILSFIKFIKLRKCKISRDSSVSTATGYGLDDTGLGVRVPVESRIFSSPRRPNQLWGPPNIVPNGYRGHFARRYSGRCVKLTTHLKLVSKSRKCGSIHPLTHTSSWCSV
jgi:hypothetical protein